MWKQKLAYALIMAMLLLSTGNTNITSASNRGDSALDPLPNANLSQPVKMVINSPVCADTDDDYEASDQASSSQVVPGAINPAIRTPSLSLDPASDTGISNSDGLTGNNMPIFMGSAAPGQTVFILDGNSQIGYVNADVSGNWNFAPPVCAALSDGVHEIRVQAGDGKGGASRYSTPLHLVIDTDPPAMPDLSVSTKGPSPVGAAVQMSGHAGPGLRIQIMDGLRNLTKVQADSKGRWSASVSDLPTGDHVLRASAEDAAGNLSPSFNGVPVTIVADRPVQASPGLSALRLIQSSFVPASLDQGLLFKRRPRHTPTATSTPVPTRTPTSLPTATNTLRPTATNTPLPTATNTSLPTATATARPTATNTALPTATNTTLPTATNTALPTSTSVPTISASSTSLPTATTTNTQLPTPSSTPTLTATPTATADAGVVVAAAGDISCGSRSYGDCQQMETSNLVVNINPVAVLPLGDNQYECGSLADYNQYYDPSWGQVKDRTFPSVGNHEYLSSSTTTSPCYNAPKGAPGYFTYFGNAATPNQPGCTANCDGYYSYDLGSWHIVVINSICSQAGGCGLGSPEEVWLKNDLAAHSSMCTLAYWHYPRFTSGLSGTSFVSGLKAFWQDLYNAGVDVVLNGHDHDYERFAPMDINGNLDTAHGIREFVVGTGGRNHQSFTTTAANSEVRDDTTYGVLKLTLNSTSYDWEYFSTTGTFTDSGNESCR